MTRGHAPFAAHSHNIDRSDVLSPGCWGAFARVRATAPAAPFAPAVSAEAGAAAGPERSARVRVPWKAAKNMFLLSGGTRLCGELEVGCAKNAVLPILAAAMLTDAPVTVEDCPDLVDARNMLSILETLGCRVEARGRDVLLDASRAESHEMPENLSKRLRSSIFMLGPLIARFGRARVSYPGGCEIGQRPIDLHLKGLRALGVTIREAHGMIECDGARLRGADVYLDFPSVGATENVMMAAVLARGRTTIHNAAREPEIRDLQAFINALGGKIRGGGTDRVTIEGVRSLGGARYRPLPDRIVAGTLLAAAAATRGEVLLRRVCPGDLGAVLDKLRQAGCAVETEEETIFLRARTLKPFEVSTQPFPGFPTDLQAQFMALACAVEGASVIVENVFENRFAHAAQLRRMGADIFLSGRLAVVRGGRLYGAEVQASDLRGGAALVIAALAAEGESRVENVELIDRGYEALETMLAALGANIRRI